MTRPQPRLPELAGMTEAGFNRVVDMIRWQDFAPRDRWGRVCGADFLESWTHWSRWRASLPKTRNKKQRKAANVPRWAEADIRKMHERSSEIDVFFTFDPGKAKARELVRQFYDGELGEPTPLQSIGSDPDDPVSTVPPAGDWPTLTAQGILDTLNRGVAEAKEYTLRPFIPRKLPCSVCGRPTGGCCTVMVPPGTPLRCLLKFATDDGTLVSFEIAEKAMKGDG